MLLIITHYKLVSEETLCIEITLFIISGTSPTTFQNVDFSDSVTVNVRGVTTLRSERQNKTLTKDGNYFVYFCTLFH